MLFCVEHGNRHLMAERAAEGVEVPIGVDTAKLTPAQAWARCADRGEGARKPVYVLVPELVGPWKRLAAFWISSTRHANLVAIEDAWRPGEREQEGESQPKAGEVAPGTREESGGIVAVQDVELNPIHIWRIQA